MTLQVTIQESNQMDGQNPAIQIPLFIIEHLKIPIKKTIQIKIGDNCVKSDFLLLETAKNSERNLNMNQKLLQKLSLPTTTIQVQAYYKNHELCLGPVIAVLTEIKTGKDQLPFFGSIHDFCGELHHYCSQVGAMVYITSLSRNSDHGYYFLNNDWVEANLPRPDFIYNRIHSRKTEKSKLFKRALYEWKKNKSILFNSYFFSKWEVHEQLEKVPHLQSFLPKTTLFEKSIFIEWMVQFNDLFIKPVYGSQGRQIMHISQNNNQIIVEQTTQSTQPSKLQFATAKQAASAIDKLINKREFIIQETIPLVAYENRKIDFRFLCHKINATDWKITSAVGRISSDNQFVSNIAQGGTLSRPMEILITLFDPKKAALIYRLMKELAIEVSIMMDQSFDGLFVELGIDIGVDLTGNPWLIEVNSKPSKQIDTVKNPIRPSSKAIINYCNNIWNERSHPDDNNGDFNANTT